MAKKRTKTNPLLDQASTAANLRYGPELQALATLQNAAHGDYLEGARQAKIGAQIIAAGNQQAQGGLADFLTRIGSQRPTGPSSSEASILANNLGLTAESAGAGIANATRRAYEGSQYQRQGLRRQYDASVGQLNDRVQQIAGDSGAFLADYYNKLVAAQDAQNFKATESAKGRQNARLTAGVTASGTVIPGSKADIAAKAKAAKDAAKHSGTLPGGAKPASNSEFGTFQKAYEAGGGLASTYAGKVREGKLTSAQAISALASGLPGRTVTVTTIDPTTGKPQRLANGAVKTHQETRPGVRGIGDPLAARAVLENTLHGGISQTTARKLHAKGISAKRLGVKVISDAKIRNNVKIRDTLNTVKNLI